MALTKSHHHNDVTALPCARYWSGNPPASGVTQAKLPMIIVAPDPSLPALVHHDQMACLRAFANMSDPHILQSGKKHRLVHIVLGVVGLLLKAKLIEILKLFLNIPTSFSLPGFSMLAKSVAPQKTRVPQVRSNLAFLSP